MEGQKPRINYSAGRKVSDDDYGSFSFQASVSLDIEEDSTMSLTLAKAIKMVEAVLTKKVKQAAKKGSLPYDDRIDWEEES